MVVWTEIRIMRSDPNRSSLPKEVGAKDVLHDNEHRSLIISWHQWEHSIASYTELSSICIYNKSCVCTRIYIYINFCRGPPKNQKVELLIVPSASTVFKKNKDGIGWHQKYNGNIWKSCLILFYLHLSKYQSPWSPPLSGVSLTALLVHLPGSTFIFQYPMWKHLSTYITCAIVILRQGHP